mgnify:CR=1 FL=1
MKKGKQDDPVTMELSSGGRTTGPMTGGLDPDKVDKIFDPLLREFLLPVKGKVKQITEYLRYDFTRMELVERAQELARSLQEIQRLEGNCPWCPVASVKKNIQSQVAEQEAKRNRLSNCVAAGYEMRDVPCEVRFNDPESKKKTVIRLDNLEIVRVLPMDRYECQEELDFEERQEAESPVPVPAPPTS